MMRGYGMLKMCATALLSVLTVAGLSGDASADDISISCYLDSWFTGNVRVSDVREAARICNTIYYDCKGKCIGCFYDSDYAEDVCADVNGTTFLR